MVGTGELLVMLAALAFAGFVSYGAYDSQNKYHVKKSEWHCTSYDYNADMCIQYSRRPE